MHVKTVATRKTKHQQKRNKKANDAAAAADWHLVDGGRDVKMAISRSIPKQVEICGNVERPHRFVARTFARRRVSRGAVRHAHRR